MKLFDLKGHTFELELDICTIILDHFESKNNSSLFYQKGKDQKVHKIKTDDHEYLLV